MYNYLEFVLPDRTADITRTSKIYCLPHIFRTFGLRFLQERKKVWKYRHVHRFIILLILKNWKPFRSVLDEIDVCGVVFRHHPLQVENVDNVIITLE